MEYWSTEKMVHGTGCTVHGKNVNPLTPILCTMHLGPPLYSLTILTFHYSLCLLLSPVYCILSSSFVFQLQAL